MRIARVERNRKQILIGKQDGQWFKIEGYYEELYAGNLYKGEHFEIEKGDTFLPPIVPGKIVAIGKNYPEHAKELTGGEVSYPTIFLKPDTALSGHNDEILIPTWAQRLDFEVELVTIIGRKWHEMRIFLTH